MPRKLRVPDSDTLLFRQASFSATPRREGPRSVVAVVGMHRSGTSLTMQALVSLGLNAGDNLLDANDYNRRGYWEAAEIVALHDRLLLALDRPWGSFQHLLPLPDDWLESAGAKQAETEIREVMEARIARAQGATLAIKDPRLSLFLPLWLRVAESCNIHLQTVLCLRNPWDVAQSLVRRDKIPQRAGEALWLLYTTSVLAHARPETTLISYFQDWTTSPDLALSRLASFTGHPLPKDAQPIYEPELSTQTAVAADRLVLEWFDTLRSSDSKLSSGLIAEARSYLAAAQHFTIWPDTLRGIGMAEDLSTALVRTINSLTADRDGQAARAKDLLAAYTAEAARAKDLQDGLNRVSADRDGQAARAKDLLEAYQTEAARSAYLAARLRKFDPRTWIGRKR